MPYNNSNSNNKNSNNTNAIKTKIDNYYFYYS